MERKIIDKSIYNLLIPQCDFGFFHKWDFYEISLFWSNGDWVTIEHSQIFPAMKKTTYYYMLTKELRPYQKELMKESFKVDLQNLIQLTTIGDIADGKPTDYKTRTSTADEGIQN